MNSIYAELKYNWSINSKLIIKLSLQFETETKWALEGMQKRTVWNTASGFEIK